MGLLMAALVLRRSAGLAPDKNRHLAAMLGSIWNRLLAAIREQMTRLRVAGLFYRDVAQVIDPLSKDISHQSLSRLHFVGNSISTNEIWRIWSTRRRGRRPTRSRNGPTRAKWRPKPRKCSRRWAGRCASAGFSSARSSNLSCLEKGIGSFLLTRTRLQSIQVHD